MNAAEPCLDDMNQSSPFSNWGFQGVAHLLKALFLYSCNDIEISLITRVRILYRLLENDGMIDDGAHYKLNPKTTRMTPSTRDVNLRCGLCTDLYLDC